MQSLLRQRHTPFSCPHEGKAQEQEAEAKPMDEEVTEDEADAKHSD